MSIGFNRHQASFDAVRSPPGDMLVLLDMTLNIAMNCVVRSIIQANVQYIANGQVNLRNQCSNGFVPLSLG